MTPVEIAELRDFITGELQKVHGALAELRGDVTELRGEVTELRGDGAEMRAGLAEVREAQRAAEEEQSRFQDLVARHHAEVTERLAQVVTVESMRRDFQAFGEAQSATDRHLDGFRAEVRSEFTELRTEMGAGFREWGDRVRALEEGGR
jgi:chromosome segregation ATPase